MDLRNKLQSAVFKNNTFLVEVSGGLGMLATFFIIGTRYACHTSDNGDQVSPIGLMWKACLVPFVINVASIPGHHSYYCGRYT